MSRGTVGLAVALLCVTVLSVTAVGCMSSGEKRAEGSADQAVAPEEKRADRQGKGSAAVGPTPVETTKEAPAVAEPTSTEESGAVGSADNAGPPAKSGSTKAVQGQALRKRRAPGRPKKAKKSGSGAIVDLMAKSRAVRGRRAPSPSRSARRAQPPEPRPRPEPRRGNTEQYTDHGVNPMTATAEDAKSTFAVDVDTGSYTIARRKLQNGQMPPASSVRVEEFVNYFGYDYPQPDSGPFGVHTEAAPSPFSAEENRYLMRVGVQGKRIPRKDRKPVHLTFLVDVSGSMRSPDKLGLAKRSLQVLVNNLGEGDTVALATYAGRTAKILDPTGLDERGRILEAIDNLRAGGSTAMNSGLEIAYKLALKNYRRDHVNRVLVLSDGDANVGPSSHRQILDRIDHFVDEGVTLSTVGFGMGNYKDTMMEQLANNGNGNYAYIDSMDEARKVFGEQLGGTLQVIAKDVKIQVEFEEDAVKNYRLIGYENRDVADKDFRNDKVDAGEIGAGHTVTALYELDVNPEAVGAGRRLATVRVRHKKPQGSEASEQAFVFRGDQLRGDISEASADFQFAAAVTAFAEKLRESPYAGDVSWALVREIASSAVAGRADRRELVGLIERAQRLDG